MNDLERYWHDLIKAHEQTVEAYEDQKLRELVVFGEFLSRLKIDFAESEIFQPTNDPPDVIFHEHKFEIFFSPGERKPHEEAKKELQRAIEEENKNQVRLVDIKLPEKISLSILVNLVESDLKIKKANKYAPKDKGELNVLIYVMQNKFPDIHSPFPNLTNLIKQGWRSVSIMISNYVIVLHAKPSAPDFIKNIIKMPILSHSEWWTPKRWRH
jgi:hypothetical protein